MQVHFTFKFFFFLFSTNTTDLMGDFSLVKMSKTPNSFLITQSTPYLVGAKSSKYFENIQLTAAYNQHLFKIPFIKMP